MTRHDWSSYISDRFAYGLVPTVGYAVLLVAAAMVFAELTLAVDVLAGSLLLLLIVNIRNAWDLPLDMVRRRKN